MPTSGFGADVRTDGDGEQEFILRFRLPKLAGNLMNWLPSDTQGHIKNVQKEQLLAIRSLIDAAIERLEDSAERREHHHSGRIEIV